MENSRVGIRSQRKYLSVFVSWAHVRVSHQNLHASRNVWHVETSVAEDRRWAMEGAQINGT